MEHIPMNKLLTILLAGTFAAGAAVAGTSATGSNTGDLAGSNTASGTGSAAAGTNHTTTAEKRAEKSGTSSMGSSAAGTANDTGTLGASGDTGLCPPGVDKTDKNHCMQGSSVGKSGKSMSKDKAMHSDKGEGENAQDKTDKTIPR
jgi:hypothetical protein